MTVTVPFLFIAGIPALDFVNTELMLDGERTDLLRTDPDLARWLGEAGFGKARRKGLVEAKELRASLRRMFVHLAGGGKLRLSDLTPLREVLEQTPGALSIELHDGAPHVEFAPSHEPSPVFLLARNAAEFLASADLSLVKACEGTGCILLFYDTTKSHTRRWCSMALCGNREKVAAHYARKRG